MVKRTSVTEAAVMVVLLAVGAAVAILVSVWNFLIETKLIWAVPFIVVGLIALRWYMKKKAEEQRIAEIEAHRMEWGDELSQWLIVGGIDTSEPRVSAILNHVERWGTNTVKALINKQITVGFTDNMVRLGLGKPTSIDNEEITEKWHKCRYIYGVPRQGATYIWFKDGKVTKIKQ